jgi:hypothetical protein
VTPEEAALAAVIGALTRVGVPYMLTGSVATSYHGRPRATHDADLIIDPTPVQLDALVAALAESGFYVDADGARVALRERRQFNVIEIAHASKIDLIVRRDTPFSDEEFARRRPIDLPFLSNVTTVTAEDSILSKLEWARRSGDSERQVADAASVVALNPSLDRIYVERWARALGVEDLWRRIAGAGLRD